MKKNIIRVLIAAMVMGVMTLGTVFPVAAQEDADACKSECQTLLDDCLASCEGDEECNNACASENEECVASCTQ